MTNSNWIGATTNTSPEVNQSAPTNSGQGSAVLVRYVWYLDAYLWLALCVCLLLIAIEKWFGVLSGFTAIVGATPALLLGLALIFGGAAYLAATTRAGARMARVMAPVRLSWPTFAASPRPAYAQDTPQWRVRTTPRSAASSKRSSASRRVMEANIEQ